MEQRSWRARGLAWQYRHWSLKRRAANGENAGLSDMGLQSTSKNWVKWYRRHLADPLKNFRRQLRRGALHPGLAFSYQGFRRAVECCDWEDAHRRLTPLAMSALKANDLKLLTEMAFSAERLGEHEKSLEWHVAVAERSAKRPESEWTIGDLADATLLVKFMESEKQGLAIGLNMAGYVAEAAAKAGRCSLVVEKRLVPLFQRTIPDIEVVAYPGVPEPKPNESPLVANPLTLKRVLGATPEDIGRRFLPLKSSPEETAELRKRYLGGRDLPLIGISWWSSHFGKDLPSVEDWADYLRMTEAVFVSIQYGDIDADLEILKAAAPGRFVVDDSVDQMKDMERFASQLGALDSVATISNTGAHLAGAMGIPTSLIRDDWFRRQWPVREDRTPWYPNTRVFGRDDREWSAVFRDIKAAGGDIQR